MPAWCDCTYFLQHFCIFLQLMCISQHPPPPHFSPIFPILHSSERVLYYTHIRPFGLYKCTYQLATTIDSSCCSLTSLFGCDQTGTRDPAVASWALPEQHELCSQPIAASPIYLKNIPYHVVCREPRIKAVSQKTVNWEPNSWPGSLSPWAGDMDRVKVITFRKLNHCSCPTSVFTVAVQHLEQPALLLPLQPTLGGQVDAEHC